MTWMTRFDRHADLVTRMCGTLGVDLDEEALRGTLPPEDLRATVVNCMSCTGAGACAGWLDEHSRGSTVTPSYCRNKERLERLANS